MKRDSIIKGFAETRVVTVDGSDLHPCKSQSVYNHSPDGFNWGYGGSGPAQLALALMLEVLPEDKAVMVYQKFKSDVVVALPDNFELKGDVILDWIRKNA